MLMHITLIEIIKANFYQIFCTSKAKVVHDKITQQFLFFHYYKINVYKLFIYYEKFRTFKTI